MFKSKHISVIIPVFNEADSIAIVIDELKSLTYQGVPIVDDIIVCDNGSTDHSGDIALKNGARVIVELEKGYGSACLAGISQLQDTDIVVFIDGDHSCVTSQLEALLLPICDSGFDLVVGSRVQGEMEQGALTLPQKYGNYIAVGLIHLIWQHRFTDLGPFRAIQFEALRRIHMQDQAFGWTVEMQVKAIQNQLRWTEIPVDSLKRIGKSKISGTISGVFFAGIGIMSKILVLRWQEFRLRKPKVKLYALPKK